MVSKHRTTNMNTTIWTCCFLVISSCQASSAPASRQEEEEIIAIPDPHYYSSADNLYSYNRLEKGTAEKHGFYYVYGDDDINELYSFK